MRDRLLPRTIRRNGNRKGWGGKRYDTVEDETKKRGDRLALNQCLPISSLITHRATLCHLNRNSRRANDYGLRPLTNLSTRVSYSWEIPCNATPPSTLLNEISYGGGKRSRRKFYLLYTFPPLSSVYRA